MACTFTYDGHEFLSELALDDFLLEKEKFRSKLGDIVFSLTSHQTSKLDLLTIASEKAKEVTSKKVEYIYGEDGKSIILKAPYIGVNKFLSGYTDSNGNLLFPEFRPLEYWQRRKNAWKRGEYTEDEVKLFPELADKNLPVTAANEEELKKKLQEMQDIIENKWENQALIGDAIHSIFQNYFSLVEGESIDTLKFKKDFLNTEKGKKSFIDELNKLEYKRKDKKKPNAKFSDLITPEILESTLERCKELEQQLETKFGKDLMYFPEYEITARMMETAENGADTLYGIIDLLVVTKNGDAHIVDYKTSPKDPGAYVKAKKLAYTYQVALYGRMLAKAGIDTDDTEYLIVPMQLDEFERIDNDKFKFSGVKLMDGIFEDLTHTVRTHGRINEVLDSLIDIPMNDAASVDELALRVVKTMAKWFPRYSAYLEFSDEQIKLEIEDAGGFLKNEETGLYTIKIGDKVIENKSEAGLFKRVKNSRNFLKNHRLRLVKEIKSQLKKGIEQGNVNVEFPDTFLNTDLGASQTWFKQLMAKYCNSQWEVMTDSRFDPLEAYGLICLYNKYSRLFDFVKISTQNPYYTHHFDSYINEDGKVLYERGKTLNLAGAFKNDVYFLAKANDLMLEGTNGNVEAMETMLIINNMRGVFGDSNLVGNILIADPVWGHGIQASNKELMYCFNLLDSFSAVEEGNNFKSGKVKMASLAHLAKQQFDTIMNLSEEGRWKDEFKNFHSANYLHCRSILDAAIDSSYDKKLAALEKIRKEMEGDKDIQNLIKGVSTGSDIVTKDSIALYYQILLAIAELRGIDFRQQLKDHSKYVETVMIHKYGLLGNYIDNPGNLSSETLNMLTKLVTEAYLNVRLDMQRPIIDIQKHAEELKKDHGFNKLIENTIGNQATIYKNIYDFSDGDIKFKKPTDPTLSTAEREFVEFALDMINKRRYPGVDWRGSDDVRYYRVPLAKGDTSSMIARKGLFAALKDRLEDWMPSKALKRAREKAEGFLNAEKEYSKDDSRAKLFEMNNLFSIDENEELRLNLIAKKGVEYFESNLETLLLKHEFAYATKERIDSVMPMLKAAMAHLSMQGNIRNMKFENDLQYAEEYIQNKVKNESIVGQEYLKAAAVLNTAKAAASKMVLAFSPVQAIYQTLQAIWNDIGLIIRKPDGTNAFSLHNMLEAAKVVYKDLFQWNDNPTLMQRLNELYGVNDMDMNTYIDRIKTDRHGMHNLTNMMFKFASRPDFYSRMTIFAAKMINEGSLKAHHLNKDGMLVYDWKQDDRFSAFANNDKSDLKKYNDQKALYIAMAKLFEAEGAYVTIDGKDIPFKLDMSKPMALPRAYTNKESESMKALGDTIYGYYSHEKKSMILSSIFGSMWMQFKTYWSGKKNLYLAGGGVKLEGKWVEYKDDGGQWFYLVDAAGNVLYDAEPTRTDTGNPVYVWQGDWKEGILSTLINFGVNVKNTGSVKEGFNSMWYSDDLELRYAYRDNMKHLAYDLVMWAVIGAGASAAMSDWYKDEKELAVPGDVADGLKLAMANIAVKSVTNSFMDFNFIESIGGPGYQWTPFAFEYLGNQVLNVYSTLLGEKKTVFDMIINSNSAMKLTKPFWDALLYDYKND